MTVELSELDIDGYLCPSCQEAELRYKDDDETAVICSGCGCEYKTPTNELWAHLQRMIDKMEWEGGMAEVLFSYSDHNFFDVNDEKLLQAAKEAEEAFNKLNTEWERVCKENGVSPYL